MKKVMTILLALILASCAAKETKKMPNIPLEPPQALEQGYLKISQQAHYYADINSVWAESGKRHLVYFDIVINMTKGLYNFDDPTIYAKSMRQSKVINCQTYQLTQLNTDYYSDFWGKGERSSLKKQRQRTIKLRKGSSLYTLSEILCVNLMR
ncbi:surface-adhesin E family protein [Actinobacillus porcinus]|uniref:surface-adhesin E family protein n=1 Tax=Actinobacillus porcinus TaxID=51048 RepID=UPI002353F5A9|nr:surface-adhesin E family protein [Actinobacillus porcinus]